MSSKMELNKKSKIPSDTTTLADEKSIHQTDTNVDSGFLSGPIESAGDFGTDDSKSSSNIIKKESQTLKNSDANKEQCEQQQDSGLIEDYSSDSIEISPSPATNKATTDMILPGGAVDPNFTEWFCGMSLEGNQPINNLNVKSRESPKTVRTPARWEIYYQQNEEGDTQLHIAVIHGMNDVVRALLRITPHPCLLDIQNDYAQTALHISVETNQSNIVRQLIVAGAKASIRDRYGNTPLHLACRNGDLACAQEIIVPPKQCEFVSRKAHAVFLSTLDLEEWNYEGEKCVHLAAQYNQIEILKLLVKYGADINAREGKSGHTPLHYAVQSNNHKLAHYLMHECPKINLDVPAYSGLTAFQLARRIENQYLVKELTSQGAICMEDSESDETDDSDSDVEEEMYSRQAPVGRFNNNTINVV